VGCIKPEPCCCCLCPACVLLLSCCCPAADKYALWDHIQLNTRVRGASFDEDRAVWCIRTDTGQQDEVNILVLAQGERSIFVQYFSFLVHFWSVCPGGTRFELIQRVERVERVQRFVQHHVDILLGVLLRHTAHLGRGWGVVHGNMLAQGGYHRLLSSFACRQIHVVLLHLVGRGSTGTHCAL